MLGVAGSARGVWAPVQGACSTQVVDLQSKLTWAMQVLISSFLAMRNIAFTLGCKYM